MRDSEVSKMNVRVERKASCKCARQSHGGSIDVERGIAEEEGRECKKEGRSILAIVSFHMPKCGMCLQVQRGKAEMRAFAATKQGARTRKG